MKTATALYEFFSGFEIPAYVKRNIPANAEMPYITYELVEPNILQSTIIHAYVWYRGTSMTEVLNKCDEISTAIGTGISIPTTDGYVCIFRESPFMQILEDPNPDVKCGFLTMLLHANT